MKDCQYDDVLLHFKENDTEDKKDVVGFPITRYDNVLNRPRAVDQPGKAKNSEFALFVCESEEVDDEDMFNLYGTIW